MTKELTEHERLIASLSPSEREKLEESRREALEEPPGFFEYLESDK
ncbi:hypothetical protein bcgnr5378_06620 [Bacillus cereus]|uniref:Uncharacterized protein n=1 Tax=Bacillus cereus TaxID=1396 RepID=A0A164L9P6_BACCE|nr:hypothetical protein [Bacillus cereus]KZD55577.1 hypothetical protein B4088_5322 [Bacillus cereus]